jgi:hypothetical protein
LFGGLPKCLAAIVAVTFTSVACVDALAGQAVSPEGNGVGSQFEMVFWQSVASSDDRAQFEAYLSQYPSGTFASLARAKIAAIDKRGAAPIAVSPTTTTTVTVASSPVSQLPAAVAALPTPEPSKAAPKPIAPAVIPPASGLAAAAAPSGVIDGSLAEQLRALGKSQGVPVASTQASLPARPALTTLTRPTFPVQFCSGFERNAFYDSDYKLAVDASDAQYQLTLGHMRALRQAHEEAMQRRDVAFANIIAAEAKAYESISKESYLARAAYDSEFARLMAIPIVKCEGKP